MIKFVIVVLPLINSSLITLLWLINLMVSFLFFSYLLLIIIKLGSREMAFPAYFQNYMFDGSAWHCELCTNHIIPSSSLILNSPRLNEEREVKEENEVYGINKILIFYYIIHCLINIFFINVIFTDKLADYCKCLAARYEYWRLNPDVYLANIDPVFHYQVPIMKYNNCCEYLHVLMIEMKNVGSRIGSKWRCDMCNSRSRYLSDFGCNCTAAISDYQSRYNVTGIQFFFFILFLFFHSLSPPLSFFLFVFFLFILIR